ncbi:unnamed protein product, partial [Prorocentrum cordatum]
KHRSLAGQPVHIVARPNVPEGTVADFRDTSGEFSVTVAGMLVFLTFSVVPWWCVILELKMSKIKHAVLAIMMLCAPACIFLLWLLVADWHRAAPWVLPASVALSASWVLLLAWSAVQWGGRWPVAWRYALFLNVLHKEVAPAGFHPSAARRGLFGQRPLVVRVAGGRRRPWGGSEEEKPFGLRSCR